MTGWAGRRRCAARPQPNVARRALDESDGGLASVQKSSGTSTGRVLVGSLPVPFIPSPAKLPVDSFELPDNGDCGDAHR